MKTEISIIVPIYNIPQKLLIACIESLINQTFKNIEIILVDDGNKDATPDICEKYAAKDNRIKVLHQKNQGVSIARNEGIRIAQSPFIAFVDADDWIEYETFEVAYKYMASNNSDIVTWELIEDKVVMPPSDFPLGIPNIKVFEFNTKKEIEQLQRAVLGGNVEINIKLEGGPCCKLYKKSIFEENNLYFKPELKRSQDNELNFLYFEYVKSSIHIPIKFYHYIRYENSATRKFNSNSKEIMLTFLDVISIELKSLKKDIAFRDDFNYIVVTKFADICRTCYAHPDNPAPLRKKIRAINELSRIEYFQTAFKEVKGRSFLKILKVIVPLVQLKCFSLVYLLFMMRFYLKK